MDSYVENFRYGICVENAIEGLLVHSFIILAE